MRPTLVSALTLAIALLSACSSDEPVAPQGLPDPGLPNVVTENASARSVTVSREGGTVTATGSNGAIYSLTIPENGVDSSVTIRMYPIAEMKSYPAGSRFYAGVHLEPEGLAFLHPATLTIELPPSVDPSSIVGTISTGNGDSIYAALPRVSGRTVTMDIAHFSQYALGDRTLERLLTPERPGVRTLGRTLQDELALTYLRYRDDGADPGSEYLRILRRWYDEEVKEWLGNFASSDDEISMPIYTYHMTFIYNDWLMAIDFCQATSPTFIDVDAEVADSRDRVARLLRYAVDIYERSCERRAGTDPAGPTDDRIPSLVVAAAQSLSAHGIARRFDVATREHALDLETILDGMCIKPVIVERALPSGLGPGGVGNLDLRAGISVMDRPARFGHPLEIRLSDFAPAIVSPSSGTTDAGGHFRTSVQWPSGTDRLNIDVLASIPHPHFGMRYDFISVFDRITRQVEPPQTLTGRWRRNDHVWNYSDGALHLGIFVEIGAENKLSAFRPGPGGRLDLMFEMKLDVTGRHFAGTVDIPASQKNMIFAGWTIIVSGDVNDDGTLGFEWNGGEMNGTRTVSGEDVLQPV